MMNSFISATEGDEALKKKTKRKVFISHFDFTGSPIYRSLNLPTERRCSPRLSLSRPAHLMRAIEMQVEKKHIFSNKERIAEF